MANFLIFMGPLLMMGISQIRGYEPGDAEWGVKLDHVRGQAEAKEEIRRVVTLWQSGEVFESAGRQARARPALPWRARDRQDDDGEGDRDRASTRRSSRSPARASRRPSSASTRSSCASSRARRRSSRASGAASASSSSTRSTPSACAGSRSAAATGATADSSRLDGRRATFFGPFGAINPSGDVICENAGLARAGCSRSARPEPRSPIRRSSSGSANIVNQGMFPGMGGMGGGLALNQLLVVMDGIDNPPFLRRVFTNKAEHVARRDLLRAAAGRPDLGDHPRASLFAIGGAVMLVDGLVALAGYSDLPSRRRWIVWQARSSSPSRS